MTKSFCVLVVFLCLAATVLCATPPAGWTCEAKYYNENNGCDCNCGVVDPDCQRSYNSLFGCPTIRNAYAYCNATAQCAYDTRTIPQSWHCDPLEYHKNDTVCNCACGAYDPDCKVATSTVVNCHYGLEASCASNGTCQYKAPLPAGWVCSGEFYDSNDGCDCNCGAYDPDCKRQTETLHCPCTEMTCSLSGFCTGFCNGFNLTVTPVSNSTSSNRTVSTRSLVTSKDEIIEILPRHKELRGAAPLFDESQKYEAFRFYLRNDFEERPSSETRQKVRELFDANSEDEDLYHLHRRDEVPVPESWTCNEAFYNARDGCDCGCGALDPDCEPGLRNQILFGCNKFFTNTSHPYCNAEGKCTPGGLEIPSDWRCFPDSYNATDACDCACGAYDPDCDHMTGLEFVFNCYDGIGPSCKVDGTCNYEIPVPDLWNCPKEYFGRQDGCDCGCGVRDPDCDDVDNTSIFGCGSCHNATELECVPEGFCIGLCRGYILDYEKLEDYNAQLEPHASKYYLEVKASSGDSPSTNSPSPINFSSSSSDASVLSFSISLLAVVGLFAFLL